MPYGNGFYLVDVRDDATAQLPGETVRAREIESFTDPVDLSWSPNGDWLATNGSEQSPEAGLQNIWLYNPDSDQERRVTNTRAFRAFVNQAVWSSNGRYLAIDYAQNPTGIEIYDLTAQSSVEVSSKTHSSLRDWPHDLLGVEQLPNGTLKVDPRSRLQTYFWEQSHPVWIEQDRRVVFMAPASEDRVALFVVDVDGTELRELLPSLPGLAGLPTLTPDGQTLAFVRYPAWNARDRVEIALVNLSTKAITSLVVLPAPSSDDELYISGLDWSPDGRYLAFSSNHEGESDIYIIASDGQAWMNLTDEIDGDAVNPIWRP
jgi:Tol biopolymer transport system component